MKNLASAREEKEKAKAKCNTVIGHGELKLKRYSLWLIIFIISVLTFLSAYYCNSCTFALEPQRYILAANQDTRRVVLDNGMVLLLKEKHNLPLVSFSLYVLSGSAQEADFSGSGISHFIEHMVFKGTDKRAVGDVFKEIESCGGNINAFTSYDYTGYKITLPAEFLSAALEVLADMMINATFDEEELEKEREVVLKEIRLSYDDPARRASRLLWENAYSVHPYKYPILGKEDLFKKLTRKDLLGFYQKKYVPNNMILAVVGDLKADEALASIKDAFKDFQKKPIADFKSQPEPEQKSLRKQEEKFTTGLTYLLFGFHSLALTDRDSFALDVLGTILGEGESSRLYESICNKKKLAYSIEAINYTPRQPGLFIISALLEEAQRRRVSSLVLKQIERVKKKKVSEKELEKAKNKIISDILFYNQTIENQAQDLALNEAVAGDFRFTEEYIQKIKQLTQEDILKVANKYLRQDNLSIVALIPRNELAKVNPEETFSQPFLKVGTENLNPPANSVEEYLLDNGIVLLVQENKELPLVSIKAVFKGGLRAEEKDTNGLCNLVANLLDKGTKSKSAEEIAYLVESKGARLSYFSGNNSFGLSLDLISEDFETMLKLMADLLSSPTFPRGEVKRQKEKNLANLRSQEDNIFSSGTRLLKTTLFQKHPFRFLTVGNEESLKKLGRREVVGFYQDFCTGNNMVLSVFGDVEADEVLAKAKEAFANIKKGAAPVINPLEEPKIKNVRISSATLNKQQSLVLMGFYGASVFDQERFTLEVICQILSQPSGKLFTQIRQKAGLAYALGAYQVLGLDPGYLVISVATTAENVETVKEKILKQLKLLKEEPLSAEELNQAKRAVLVRKLLSRQTNSACALESSLNELYGLGFNYHLGYAKHINRITACDITRCANRYFDLNNYAMVVVGP
ncbi:MAG: insulinase family protein [Candidatus Omnitrophica bacterium]|nr:insulinase family protein [Candidatus Omnitrophota bacterium]